MEHLFDDGVTVKRFFGFVSPSVIMLLVIGLYSVIDSIFIANCVNTHALAALNIVYPVFGFIWGVSVMLAAGSSALVAIKMGQGKALEANQKFTLIYIVATVMALIMIVPSIIFIDELLLFLGASDVLWDYCRTYGMILIFAMPAGFIGVLFEFFIRVDGKPGFTLALYMVSGAVHILLDVFFLVYLDWGIEGAAWATFAGMYSTVIMGAGYFIFRHTNLKFVKPKMDWAYIGHSMSNGSSEMVSESSVGIMVFFFNYIMIHLAGETGVAALTIVLQILYFMVSVYLGYVTGVAPLISYYYGAKEYEKVNCFLRYSKNFILFSSILISAVCLFFAPMLSGVFVPAGSEIYEMSTTGIRFMAIGFLFTGINIFASGFFTAYGNGKISALISLCRGLVLVIIFAFLLSYFFGINGVWLALVLTDIVTLLLSLLMFRKYKKRYHYSFR